MSTIPIFLQKALEVWFLALKEVQLFPHCSSLARRSSRAKSVYDLMTINTRRSLSDTSMNTIKHEKRMMIYKVSFFLTTNSMGFYDVYNVFPF